MQSSYRFPVNPVMRSAMTEGFFSARSEETDAFASLLLPRVNSLTRILILLISFIILFSSQTKCNRKNGLIIDLKASHTTQVFSHQNVRLRFKVV